MQFTKIGLNHKNYKTFHNESEVTVLNDLLVGVT